MDGVGIKGIEGGDRLLSAPLAWQKIRGQSLLGVGHGPEPVSSRDKQSLSQALLTWVLLLLQTIIPFPYVKSNHHTTASTTYVHLQIRFFFF